MKRFAFAIGLLLLALSINSCSNKGDSTSNALIIKEIHSDTICIENIDSLFNANKITYHPIEIDNWGRNGGYAPDVKFAMAHSNNNILLQYVVTEDDILATYGEDAGSRPYMDSCVEFFWKPYRDSSFYYNLEMNCIGYGLFAVGDKIVRRNNIEREHHDAIKRFSTLGDKPFGLRRFQENGENSYSWSLSLIIPASSLLPLEENPTIKGRSIYANFYKCGSEMPQPHYLSWMPIHSENPNFHQPQFFGEIIFE